MYTLGFDASGWQGAIDPQLLIKAGAKFVILKATEINRLNGPVDPLFLSNKAACEAAGLLVGAYAFIDPFDGVPQADLLIATAGNVVMVADLEAGGVTLGEIETFCTEFESKIGHPPLLYTADYVLDNIQGHASQILSHCPLWLAQVGARQPFVPKPWTNWTIWQAGYQNIGARTFDVDYFNGSLDDLKRFWMDNTAIAGTQVVPLVATDDIVAFKTAGGEVHSIHKAGESVTIDPVSKQSVNNIDYFYDAPYGCWFRGANVPGLTAPPLPVTYPYPMVTTAMLRIRKAADFNSPTLVIVAQGTVVSVTGPGLGGTYNYTPVSVTWQGAPYVGFASGTFLANPK